MLPQLAGAHPAIAGWVPLAILTPSPSGRPADAVPARRLVVGGLFCLGCSDLRRRPVAGGDSSNAGAALVAALAGGAISRDAAKHRRNRQNALVQG